MATLRVGSASAQNKPYYKDEVITYCVSLNPFTEINPKTGEVRSYLNIQPEDYHRPSKDLRSNLDV